MEKILLSLLLFSSLLLSDESIEDKKLKIIETKQKIASLQKSLQELETSLPKKIEDKKIKTHAEFGFVNNKGNTNSNTLTLDAKIEKAWGKHNLSFLVDGEYASDEGEETKNKYLLELEYDYKLKDRLYFEYLIGYKYDEFSGYNYQAYTGPGLKYIAIDTKKHKLEVGNNILYAIDEAEDTKEKYDYLSYRAKALYSWQILENLKFEETLTYRTDISKIDNYFLFSKTALISKITDIFSVSLSYKVDYVNEPKSDTKRTDRTTTANLIADF
ncbi:MAG: DUF481 domain-containing protein [Sulfurimonas sp.]|nr:DUF481 domain-containing protein [Sulfurimonas sp.]